MKRIISVFVVLLVLISLICLPACAANGEYVVDDAGFLSSSDEASLESAAAAVSEKYGCGVYILTVPDLEDMGYGSDPYVAAYSHYRDNALGLGGERNGIIIFISARYLDYAVFVYGDGAEYAIDEDGITMLEDEYIDYLSAGLWYEGFKAYIDGCGRYLELAEQGEPVRAGEGGSVLIGVVIGLAAALIVCLIQKNKLKSVRKGTQAGNYNVGGLDLTKRIDQFTHTTVSKRKIEKSSGGGNSVARSGGGGHGRSGRL